MADQMAEAVAMVVSGCIAGWFSIIVLESFLDKEINCGNEENCRD